MVFGGRPKLLLAAVLDGTFEFVATEAIVEEYERAVRRHWVLNPGSRDKAALDLVTQGCLILPERKQVKGVRKDPDDDKFLAYALSTGAKVIVSGDKALLATDGCEGLRVMTVRAFSNEFLGSTS